MSILILSNSLVVIELFKIALLSKYSNVEFAQSISSAQQDSYDIIFVDENISNLNSQIEDIESNIDYGELIAITNSPSEYATVTLKKPFLAEDINRLLEELEQKKQESEPANVLDLDEIERIKSIMALNDYEENLIKKDPIEALSARESFKAKNKNAKKVLKELCKMDKKKLKELFKSAKVTIKIDFKA
jgi:hypothetical protein